MKNYYELMEFVPGEIRPEFFKNLSNVLFLKFTDTAGSEEFDKISGKIFAPFTFDSGMTKELLKNLPNSDWERSFLRFLLRNANMMLIGACSKEIASYMNSKDPDVQSAAVELLMNVNIPALLPTLIDVAETSSLDFVKTLSRSIVKHYVETGII